MARRPVCTVLRQLLLVGGFLSGLSIVARMFVLVVIALVIVGLISALAHIAAMPPLCMNRARLVTVVVSGLALGDKFETLCRLKLHRPVRHLKVLRSIISAAIL